MIDVSGVTGTYNRLPLLQSAVAAFRQSCGAFSHELVIVDGGSTDGTLAWARRQPDLVLIEQGALLGCVPAFNAGFARARGRYVAILNDDQAVEGETIARAAAYLDANPDVGQVAFRHRYQRRHDGQATPYWQWYNRYVYGQSSLVRRLVGDLAGWWSTEYRSYGGDTHLSCRLWELGWEVVPLPECIVTDHEVQDELRRKNNVAHGPHPDGVHFGQLWNGRLPEPERWQPAHGAWLQTKAARQALRVLRYKIVPPGMTVRPGMTDGFAPLGPTMLVDHSAAVQAHGQAGFQDLVRRQVREFEPDLVLFQAHGPDNIQPETIAALRRECPRIAFINWDGDARPVTEWNVAIAAAVHLQLVVSPDLIPQYAARGARNVGWWPESWQPEFMAAQWAPPAGAPDVVFMGNYYGDRFPQGRMRAEIVHALMAAGWQVDLYGGGWRAVGLTSRGQTGDDRVTNAAIYAGARLGLSTSQYDDLWGYASDRMYHLLATGCPALIQRFKGDTGLGLLDGENCLLFATADEAVERARWALAHPPQAAAIGAAGKRLMQERHSWTVRAKTMVAMLDRMGIP